MPKSMEETTKVFSPSQNLKIFEYKGSGSFFGTIQKLYLSPNQLSNLSSFFSVGCSIINRNKLLPIYRNKIQENNKKVPMCIKVRYHWIYLYVVYSRHVKNKIHFKCQDQYKVQLLDTRPREHRDISTRIYNKKKYILYLSRFECKWYINIFLVFFKIFCCVR